MKTSIAQRLIDLQINLSLTKQSDLARYIGVKPQEISDLKRGKVKKLSVSFVRSLQKKGINPEWFESGEGEMMEKSYTYSPSNIATVSDSEMKYYATPDLSKMNIDEMKEYYKTLHQHEENKKKIEEIFKVLGIEL